MHSKTLHQACRMEAGTEQILCTAMSDLNYSVCTVVNLAAAETIQPNHISEAIQYRTLDR